MTNSFSAPPLSSNSRFMLSFILVASTAGLGIGTAKVAISLFAIELNASEFEMGLIAASQMIGILFMGLPAGALIKRYGPLFIFSLGSLLAGLCYALTPWVQHAWFLILFSALASFCMPLRFVSLNTVFMSHLYQIGAAKAGWFRGAHMIGFMLIGPILAVWFTHNLGFIGGFIALGALFIIPVIIAPTMFNSYQIDTKKATPISWKSVIQPLYLLKKEKTLRYVSLLEFASSASMMYFTFFIVVIAIQNYGFSATAAASLVSLYGAIYMVTLFTVGHLFERLGKKHFYQISSASIATGLFFLALPWGQYWLWTGSAILGVGLGGMGVANLSTFAQIGQRVGMENVSALSSFFGPVGSLLSGVVGGLFGYVWGLQNLFFIWMFLFLGLLVLLQIKQPFNSPEQPQITNSEVEILTNVDGQ
ncbi:hypothetical protein B9T31_13650 [Acinetobacter sp. ANC 4558]|uniref:MFS transporter n=1 Tax=Acinetobacter sp. ANC 4558 TaxID=1977876 RepID=UPI000A351E3D|nr:MFS transporter [Acinetobacter sp. ANC 4558]OTG84195.1 hypothetical protein B9T31_13650 [Acinetobacter sp. ANC 4558]